MEKKDAIILYVIVGSLGLISAVLAFAGEGTKIKSSDVKMVGNVCDYPKSAAAVCGFFSWLLLSATQIAINVFSVYSFCQRHQHSNSSKRENAWCCFASSWVTFVIALLMLLVANGASNLRYHPTLYDYCYVLKPGVFSGAAVLVLVTVALGITCHVLLSPSDSSSPRPRPRPRLRLRPRPIIGPSPVDSPSPRPSSPSIDIARPLPDDKVNYNAKPTDNENWSSQININNDTQQNQNMLRISTSPVVTSYILPS